MSKWFKNILWGSFKNDVPLYENNEEVFFHEITIHNTIPDLTSIKEKEFVKVTYKRKPYWAIFRCPCGCLTVITLPLQRSNHHYWQLRSSKNDRPTLYPSIWQNKGCCSHFIVNDGKIVWCDNSGHEPYSDVSFH